MVTTQKKRMTQGTSLREAAEGKTVSKELAAAIRKRKASKSLNALFSKGVPDTIHDRRTQARLARIREELKTGKTKKGEEVKAVDAVLYASELLKGGMTLTELLSLVGKRYHVASDAKRPGRAMLAPLREFNKAYDDLDPRVWRMFNVDPKLVTEAA